MDGPKRAARDPPDQEFQIFAINKVGICKRHGALMIVNRKMRGMEPSFANGPFTKSLSSSARTNAKTNALGKKLYHSHHVSG